MGIVLKIELIRVVADKLVKVLEMVNDLSDVKEAVEVIVPRVWTKVKVATGIVVVMMVVPNKYEVRVLVVMEMAKKIVVPTYAVVVVVNNSLVIDKDVVMVVEGR